MDEFRFAQPEQIYYISAEVVTERQAYDYRYCFARQQGRDLFADVPTSIITATLRVWDESGRRIIGPEALRIAELALPSFAEFLREIGGADIIAGDWQ
jgi:hypothetical protein